MPYACGNAPMSERSEMRKKVAVSATPLPLCVWNLAYLLFACLLQKQMC